jgi:hypothetical protein
VFPEKLLVASLIILLWFFEDVRVVIIRSIFIKDITKKKSREVESGDRDGHTVFEANNCPIFKFSASPVAPAMLLISIQQ